MAENSFTEESTQIIRIPLKRIGVLIGKDGSNRKLIEEKTKSKISIDSETGEVEITPTQVLNHPVLLLKAKDIVNAIGRGFSIQKSLQLVDDNQYFEIIRLKQFTNNAPNRLKRIKSRIIGTKGKTKTSIETLTHTTVVVSGSTISIIGQFEQVGVAKEAMLKIINGSRIESVLSFLDDKKREFDKIGDSLWKSEEEIKQDKLEEMDEEDIFKEINLDNDLEKSSE